MRNVLKAATMESKFPLLAVENDCIISKEADITLAYKVELPEIFTLSGEEYENLQSLWHKAIKVLPDYSIVHKQDWFIEENYKIDTEKEDQTFLSRASELHFHERPFLNHFCYLYLTKTTKEKSRQQSNFSTLCRGFLVPKEIRDSETVKQFIEAVEQFTQIINESGTIQLTRLTADEIAGTKEKAGLIEKYFCLSQNDTTSLQDIEIGAKQMRIGDKILCLHTLSDTEDLPTEVKTDIKYERFSTDRTDCLLSFAAPMGLLLSCNHLYNQYIFIDNHTEILKRFEKEARNMHSLSRYSRENQINKQWIEAYLNTSHSLGLTSIRAHFNVMAWGETEEQLKQVKNDTGAQIAVTGCKPRYNTVDVPTLYWAGIPGNAAEFPAEESFYTFIPQALCFFNQETNYRDSPSHFGVKLTERLSGKPIHVDISDYPKERGWISNRNKFILGGSGSGKSFAVNHFIRQYYEQGAHIVMIDVGNSYKGQCELINKKTKGNDGIYFTYTIENPISFNPFYTEDSFFDMEKKESIKTLILTLWKKDSEEPTRAEEVALSNAINLYIQKIIRTPEHKPSFNRFYEFIRKDYRFLLKKKNVREKDFDITNFLNVLEPYYKGGEYDYLLNSDKELDLLNKRFVVFEIDTIKDHPILFSVVTIIIMEAFINKMRRLQGIRKLILIEEAWKAIAKEGMAEYIKYLFKTVRKFEGEAWIISQEVQDLVSSPIVKESIINNSDCKILLDQRKYLNKFDTIQQLLGLTDKEKAQILSVNMGNDQRRKYKEIFISLGGVYSNVYATEVSASEYYAYTTDEKEKTEVFALAEKLGGNLEQAIKQIADNVKNKNSKK